MLSKGESIGTALLSYGMSGEVFHGPLLRNHPGFRIVSVMHRNPPASPSHTHRVVQSIDRILNDPEVELVVVNTPNETHFDFTRKVILAGKHAVVEKPFTVTSEEADELIALANKEGVTLTVFQNRRWDNDFLTVKALLDEKRLGNLVEFEAHYDRFRNTIDESTWKERTGAGTGVLYNLGSHMIDQALVLFGAPRRVDARVGIQRPGGRIDDFYDVRMEYERFLVILKSSYLVREAGPRYVLHGTNGSFVKYGLDPQEQDLKDGKLPGAQGWGVEDRRWWGKLNTIDREGTIETAPGNYLAFYDNLFEVIRRGADMAVTPESARDVIRMIEYCYASNASKCAVEVGDANRMNN